MIARIGGLILAGFGSWYVLGIQCSAESATDSRLANPSPIAPNGSMICGPQSVQYVLEYFGKKEPISTIVYEIQWPDLEKGTSVTAIVGALARRGIVAKAVRIPRETPISWPYPIILHYPIDNGIGHFAVLTQVDGGRGQRLWIGPDRERDFPEYACFGKRSEVVVLTGQGDITDSMVKKAMQKGPNAEELLVMTVEIGLVFVLTIVLGFLTIFKEKKHVQEIDRRAVLSSPVNNGLGSDSPN